MRVGIETVADRIFAMQNRLNAGPCTIKQLQEHLGVSHSCAWKYMQIASVKMPLIEDEGSRPRVFRLIKKLDI
ncbi:MAG: hypothetical protein SWO11_23245 [Thermodesulfobacteriota bacterium]|jgi:hypothetical protein|nr:hypothetical protein [Thermodesulfobacteriota bacterium]